MVRDPTGRHSSTDSAGRRLSQRPLLRRLWVWLILAGVILAGCGGTDTAPATVQPSPTAAITTLDGLEAALMEAAASFEIAGPVEPAPAWQGRRYRINGEPVTALQAEVELNEDQVEAAFSSFASGSPTAVQQWRSQRLAVFYSGSQGGITLLLSGLLGDPQTLQPSGQNEPYPPAVSAAIQRVSQLADLPPGGLAVESYQAVPWPDSCLGLPEPDEECVPGTIMGWQIHLRAGDQTWQIHSDGLGEQMRLQ